MDKYLIAMDLDGTIIPGLYDVSDYTIEVLKALNKMGHKVVISTGRPFRSSFFVYSKAKLNSPIINYNGQLITYPNNSDFKEYSDVMEKDDLLDVYNHEKNNFTLFFSEYYDTIYTNYDSDDSRILMHHNEFSEIVVGDLNDTLKYGAHGTLLLAKEGKGHEIMDYVKKNHKDIGARLWNWKNFKEIIELYSLKHSKADAFEYVRDYLKIDEEHTIACGDSINDLEIFKKAKITVVPKNADERIKRIASIILDKNCEEDAIALFLNDYFKLGVEKR